MPHLGATNRVMRGVNGLAIPCLDRSAVPWICDALLSNHSVKAYGRDLMDFARHMQAQGVEPSPGVQKNSTPSLTQRQAISMLEAIPTDTLQGLRDLAMMSVFFLTGCRVSAVTGVCVGHLETDGVEHYLHVTEKRNKKRRKILLDAARPVLAYVSRAGIGDDKEGPLFRPMRPDGAGLVRRHLDRKTPWRLVKGFR